MSLLSSWLRKLQGRSAPSCGKPSDYLDFYRRQTDQRVLDDPQRAIGGQWETIGLLQFDFLRGAGLLPEHSLLDIGCGTLRGGRHFVRYLNPGHYTGIDISEQAILAARQCVEHEQLSDRRPRLLLNTSLNLQFTEFPGESFDFLLAQSVFTHLLPPHIGECFAHLHRVMHPRSAFFFTHFDAPAFTPRTDKDFAYPRAFFEELAARHQFRVEDLSDRYPHPRSQHMLCLRPAS